ncbi:hypothetical protein ACQVBX_01575 [Dyella sp. KULCS107]|uniref:hypothetical protein n=1 Tax=Dyella sp. KULCS107 TaxID=3422216 RepID=UPI003D6DE2B2
MSRKDISVLKRRGTGDVGGHVDNLARQQICAPAAENVKQLTLVSDPAETVYVTAITE